MPEEPKKISCPNCQQSAIKEGNEITCENCDATFTLTKTGGAKLREIGRLKALEERMERQENLLQGLLPEPESDLGPESDPEPEPSILG